MNISFKSYHSSLKLFKHAFIVVCLSIPLGASCSTKLEELQTSQLAELLNSLTSNNESTTRKLSLAGNISLTAEIEGTTKGNGTIKFNNLFIRIYDNHDDGVVYENDALNLDTFDITGDGIKEIIISGTLKYTGDKESDPASYKSLTVIYQLDCKTGLFNKLFQQGNYSIELATPQSNPVVCK